MTDLNRRRLLAALAAAPAGAVPFALAARAQEAGLITGNVCVVTPETTAGPFYVDPGLVRSDITGDRQGTPLTLRLQVVDAGCRPIPDARVDVWHCDAAGIYSGVRSPLADARGATSLRGTQPTDGQGIARFTTIYPGWYPGRTPHIHFKVFPDDRSVLTSQLFFPDGASREVYDGSAAYDNGPPDTTNGSDFIARRAGEAAVASVSGTTSDLRADLVVGLSG
ncbi:intradiol ring-cleavage dioxygenase [Psychromarinibacter sp. C21-152]|uniref:Intradiol ring-cleavage dioxygenase n=1 Tax=Psychromarinibacter sediminicola TaxID=3033385 RepID=A0AAE3TAS6_9RHOB|nr:intradiol ring-cleavage dioxygenase [Psychromarinibacter sediminicola]MDF0602304.1 intradiol ring-cleavage dioxygenase [Psychromarinibacter sediminicola]